MKKTMKKVAAKKPAVRKMATGGVKGDPTKEKKSSKVAKMSDSEVRFAASRMKYGEPIMGFNTKQRTFEENEILKKDLDINRRNTNSTNVNVNRQGTKTVVNKQGTPEGLKKRVKVTRADGTTYYKESTTPYKYKKGGSKPATMKKGGKMTSARKKK